jgi:hypothetical protein
MTRFSLETPRYLHVIIEEDINTGVETLDFKYQMESFVQYWQFVTECTVP